MAASSTRRKADDPVLRAEVEILRRAGKPVPRAKLAKRFGVGEATIQAVRGEIDHMLAAEALAAPAPPEGPIAGRTVQEFSGARLLWWRRHRFLMQAELGERAGVSRGELGHLERDHRKPTLRTLRRIAEALEVDPGELLRQDEREAAAPPDLGAGHASQARAASRAV